MKKYLLPLLLLPVLIFALSSCSRQIDYTDFVSEYKKEIYFAKDENFTLKCEFSDREYPYAPDGICGAMQHIVQLTLTAQDNTLPYEIYFTVNGKECGGELSYYAPEQCFRFSQEAEIVSIDESIEFSLAYNDQRTTLSAKRFKTGKEMDLPQLISSFVKQEKELFSENEIGELYVRLTGTEKPYYFICVILKDGGMPCFLLDAEHGNVLSKR